MGKGGGQEGEEREGDKLMGETGRGMGKGVEGGEAWESGRVSGRIYTSSR